MATMGSLKDRGTLYVKGNSTAESTVNTVARQITGPTFSKKGESGLTVDTANNKITITKAGDYFVHLAISFTGATGKTINGDIYIGGTSSGYDFERQMSSSDAGVATCGGVVTLAAGDEVSVYQYADSTTTMTVLSMQLTAIRLS